MTAFDSIHSFSVSCACWFKSQRWWLGVKIGAHGNGLVIAFILAGWWRAWVNVPFMNLLGGWLALEPWSSGVTYWLIRQRYRVSLDCTALHNCLPFCPVCCYLNFLWENATCNTLVATLFVLFFHKYFHATGIHQQWPYLLDSYGLQVKRWWFWNHSRHCPAQLSLKHLSEKLQQV